MDKLLNSTYENTSIFSLEGKNISGKCVDIYDGDTMTLSVSISGNIYKFKMRLSGIDTPEIRPRKNNPNRDEEKGAAIYVRNRVLQLIVNNEINLDKKYSKKEVRKILGDNKNFVYLKCGKFDKFGRCLVKVFLNEEDLKDQTKSINKILLREKLAYKYYGKTKNNDFKSYFKID
jgi:endonuclease YncB( thermonuclease family)